jgi:hypothetical protein
LHRCAFLHDKQHCHIEFPTSIHKNDFPFYPCKVGAKWVFCEAATKNKVQSFSNSIFTRRKPYRMDNLWKRWFILNCSYICMAYFWVLVDFTQI